MRDETVGQIGDWPARQAVRHNLPDLRRDLGPAPTNRDPEGGPLGTGTALHPTRCACIERQPVFVVATAAPDGRVNVSPKGMGTLRILGDAHVRWLDLSGSGNETASHPQTSSRMPLKFRTFEGSPMILRVHGQATASRPRDRNWDGKVAGFPVLAGSRRNFDLRVDLVRASRGSGIPVMRFVKNRGEEELVPYCERMSQEGVTGYWRRKNTVSIDSMAPGILDDD